MLYLKLAHLITDDSALEYQNKNLKSQTSKQAFSNPSVPVVDTDFI